MGDICIIATRNENGTIEYGFFDNIGNKLITESKKWKLSYQCNLLTYSSKTENEIFEKFGFADYCYFLEPDGKWYFILPSALNIKIPLKFIKKRLIFYRNESQYFIQLEQDIIKYMLNIYPNVDMNFADLIRTHNFNIEVILNTLLRPNVQFPLYEFADIYGQLCDYFDNWVIVNSEKSYSDVEKFTLHTKETEHIETLNW